MSSIRENLYKLGSEELSTSQVPSKYPKFTPHVRVGIFPTSKPDPNTVLRVLEQKKLTQNKVAKLAGVKRQVVNDFLRGRIYKNSPAQDKLLRWFFENGFEECFPKKRKKHICTCPHCGAKHIAVFPFKKKQKR